MKRFAVCLCFIHLLALATASAQCCTQLSGKVTAVNGAAIVGATVTEVSPDKSARTATTGSDGRYVLPDGCGNCTITVTAPGFKTEIRENVTVSLNSVLSFELSPAELTAVSGDSLHWERGARWEYGPLVQYGNGLTDNRNDFRFLMAGVHLGRILTPVVGSGALRGNFEYAVELFPFWQSYTPKFQRLHCTAANVCTGPYPAGGTYTGASITPIILRWNLTSGRKFMPWIQGGGGVIWTNHKYPAIGNLNPADLASNGPAADTSVWNFSPQFGVGVHYFLRPRRSIDFGANAVHISSASLGDKNPGVNASVHFNVGYTWWK